MKALKLVTFDVTGTLLKFQTAPAIVYSQHAKEFGINVSADAISSGFKTEWKKMSTEHPNYGCHSGLGWHKWWKNFVKNTILRADPTLCEEAKLDHLSEFLINEYKTSKPWKLADGATDILDSLKSTKLTIGVISNYDPRLDAVLDAVGIRQYFTFVVTSYGAGVMKPDIRIFKAAEAQIPNIHPSNCLHVGNDLELDYHGAINAGWSAAIINSDSNNYKEKDVEKNIFTSLSDLQKALEQTNYTYL